MLHTLLDIINNSKPLLFQKLATKVKVFEDDSLAIFFFLVFFININPFDLL